MPIKVSPVAGCRFRIGSASINLPDGDAVEADFAAVTWVEVDGYETMSSAGDGAQPIDGGQSTPRSSTATKDSDHDVRGILSKPGTLHCRHQPRSSSNCSADRSGRSQCSRRFVQISYPGVISVGARSSAPVMISTSPGLNENTRDPQAGQKLRPS